jgi:hypothetical protein
MDKKANKSAAKQTAEYLKEMRGTFALFDLPMPLFGFGR